MAHSVYILDIFCNAVNTVNLIKHIKQQAFAEKSSMYLCDRPLSKIVSLGCIIELWFRDHSTAIDLWEQVQENLADLSQLRYKSKMQKDSCQGSLDQASIAQTYKTYFAQWVEHFYDILSLSLASDID